MGSSKKIGGDHIPITCLTQRRSFHLPGLRPSDTLRRALNFLRKTSMSGTQPTIMIVDDSKTILRTAKMFLEPAYKVVPVDDGYKALAAVEETRPDLLFLDVMMPRLDGYKACMAIKNNPEYENMPIVILSSKDSPFDRARGMMMGCDDYLTKPFTKEQLLDSVRKHLRARQG
jgi:twitching motility two-component system response regulator PilG